MKGSKNVIKGEVVLERENKVWELRTKSWTQARIAKEIGITQVAVLKILRRLTERYSKELMEDVITVKRIQVTQLEHISDEAMQAWERSKEKSVTLKKKAIQRGNDKARPNEVIQEERDQEGDPRYLTTAMKAKEDIRKIIGADAPVKTVQFNRDMSTLSEAELLSIVNGEIPQG